MTLWLDRKAVILIQWNHAISNLWNVNISLSRKHTGRESSRMCLHSAQQHGYALPRLPEIHWKPPKYRRLYNPDMQWWSHDVHNRGVCCKVFLLQYSWVCYSWTVSLARLPCLFSACFCKLFGKLSYCLGHRLFVRQACTAFMLFGLLINHSASSVLSCSTSFRTVWSGF